MSALGIWLMFVIIGVLTFLIRFSSIGLLGHAELPPLVRRALRYVPPAVLSAIFVPELVITNGNLNLSPANPRLIAGILAILVAWKTRNMLITIAVGMAALWGISALLAIR